MLKKSISLIVAAVLVASTAVMLFSCKTTYDYVQTVKNYKPFEDDGLTTQFGTVVDKYIESPDWKSRTENDTQYVDLKGKFKGGSEEILLTFKLTPIEGEEGMFLIEPYAFEADGEPGTDMEMALFMYYMYYAYEGGYDTIDDYANSIFGSEDAVE